MFRIVICDDKKENITFLSGSVRRAADDILKGKKIEILSAKPQVLYDYQIKDDSTYIFFIDVIYDGLSGINIAERLRRQHRDIYIIFWTRHIELLYMAINQNIMPSGFFDKRINENDLKKILLAIYDYSADSSSDNIESITINTGTAIYKVRYSEIIYIEALNKKIYIYTDTQRICCYDSLQNLCEKLGSGFARCHKSFVINLSKVKSVFAAEMYIEMVNGAKIQMSRTYKTAIKSMLK